MMKHQLMEKPGVANLGSIEGTAVNDILLDNGCSRTLVQKDFIPKEKLLEANLSPLILLFVEAVVGSKGYRGCVWEESGK